MDSYLRKYFWTGWPLVIVLGALFAARATGQLVVALVPAPKAGVRPTRALGGRAAPLLLQPQRNMTPVVERNIFCAACKPQTLDEGAGMASEGVDGEPSSAAPVKSSLPLTLVATMVSVEDQAWSFAALHDKEAGRTGLYGIGSKVPGDAAVSDVLERRVLLQNGSRTEYIDLLSEPDESVAPSRKDRAPRSQRSRGGTKVPEEIAAGVRSVGPNKWEIQRTALNKVLSNTTMLARSARIVPSVRNGKPNGFKLYAIRPGSIYSLIGMQNGDTINAINGRPMTTPDRALEVYTKVRNASHLTISFTRRGKTQTHDYVIR